MWKAIKDEEVRSIYKARVAALDYLGPRASSLNAMAKEVSKHKKTLCKEDVSWILDHLWVIDNAEIALRKVIQRRILETLPTSTDFMEVDKAYNMCVCVSHYAFFKIIVIFMKENLQ
jgi:hypothetical protein